MFASNIDKYLIQIPCVTKFASRLSKLFCIARRKFKAPLPDRFITDDHTPGGKKLLHLPEAERETIVEPNGTANHRIRESMAFVN